MSDEISIALVSLAAAACLWLAVTRDRVVFAPLEGVVGDVAVTAAFASCFLLTSGVTSGAGIAGVAAAAVLIVVGLSCRRAVAP